MVAFRREEIAMGSETGMGVVAALDGKSIGVQLPDYHADEDPGGFRDAL